MHSNQSKLMSGPRGNRSVSQEFNAITEFLSSNKNVHKIAIPFFVSLSLSWLINYRKRGNYYNRKEY